MKKRNEFLTHMMQILITDVQAARENQENPLAILLLAGNRPDYANNLANGFEQMIGYVLWETNISVDEIMSETTPILRGIFDTNVRMALAEGHDIDVEAKFAQEMGDLRQRLESVYKNMGEKWYGMNPMPKRDVSEGFTPYDGTYLPVNNAIPAGVLVEIEDSEGNRRTAKSDEICWGVGHNHPEVIGYRVLETIQ